MVCVCVVGASGVCLRPMEKVMLLTILKPYQKEAIISLVSHLVGLGINFKIYIQMEPRHDTICSTTFYVYNANTIILMLTGRMCICQAASLIPNMLDYADILCRRLSDLKFST